MNERILVASLLVLGVGCVDVEDEVEVGGSVAEVTVTWTNVVGAAAVANDLTKTAPQTSWNAGASSVEMLTGDGYVEFTTAETNTDKMLGLNASDTGVGFADIDFAIYLRATGTVAVYEGGTSRGGFGSYVAGDVFRIEANDGVVRYLRNGSLLYTSNVAPTFPLVADASLRTLGATLNDVQLESFQFWTNVVGASANDNDLIKTAPQTAWNAGASSVESIPGDGSVEFTTLETNKAKMAGLNEADGGTGYAEIDFALYLKDTGKVGVYEGGVSKGSFGAYVAGDVFRINVDAGVVTYYRNGGLLYTSLTAASSPLVFDTSLRATDASVVDVAVVSVPAP